MKLKTNIIYISVLLLAIALLAGCTSQKTVTFDTTSPSEAETTGMQSPEDTKETTSETPEETTASEDETDTQSNEPSESETVESESEDTTESTDESSTETEQSYTPPPPVYYPPTPPQNDVQLTYIDGILVVNKTYALPSTYAPGYNAEAYSSLTTMFTDAKNQGYTFWVASGYRSYYDQKVIYNNYVAWDGQAAADRYSARPGHSEHQTGLAFDLNYLTAAFGSSPEGIWLAENCHKYGFIIRYPQGKEHITGYMYEPWHVRYIGIEKATAVYESGLCLEEYLGITSSYS